MKNTITAITVAYTIGSLILFVALARWGEDFRLALVGTGLVLAGAIYVAVKWLDRLTNKYWLNHWQPINVVGCSPGPKHKGENVPKKGTKPFLNELHQECVFVAHKDVFVVAADYQRKMEKAQKGAPPEICHPIIINTYSFQEPVTRAAALESWYHQDGEIDDSYPARIIRGVKASIQDAKLAQYKRDVKGYHRAEMGQRVPVEKEESANTVTFDV